ncbi:CmcI family methyltransferase [Actinopolymorpha rutila]|uniref:Cephalosporin hydroxylase n=1 Tax=Actinopolymorpha rutila TaxID=446787 RepID=A0A852ZP65_9ACTN|nr:CmcI family methyltransferase [Actinopolymorpha rutila]NYH93342.1 cephalosporin hydroxylase [Actinopolymorpha rutila]
MARRAKRGKGAETGRQALEAISRVAGGPVDDSPSPEHIEAVAAALEQLWDRSTGRIRPSKRLRRAVIDQFHRIYYGAKGTTWHNTYYRGVKIWKCPLDVWLYQEIMHEVQPDLIIETGTAFGGSGYFLADMCETMGRGRVVSIDIKSRTGGLVHPRLTFLIGSSTDPALKKEVLAMLPEGGKTLIILDSDHSQRHVLDEMRLWHDVVSTGSYLIVEDSNINGHPVDTTYGPGPWEAIDEFMKKNGDFEIDESKHKFLMTLNPRGYLKKVK